MDNRTFAADLYEFLKDNDSLGHFEDIPAEDSISELEEYLSDFDMVKETIRDIEGIADAFDDHEVYVNEVKPLLKGLRAVQEKLEAEREAAKQPPPESAPQEKVAGYAISERVKVGKKTFVLAGNPKAVSPFVTWQQLEGRSGYDLGHYFSDRDKALADLHTRADRERESTSPVKAPKPRNRDDAR
jgi:hypothetical protein